MPVYDFRDKVTGEVIEKTISYNAKLEFLAQNPNMESVILTSPSLGDPTKLTATRKYDGGFKDVLQKIHEKSPGSQLDQSSSQLK